jgi:hypothetical protein
MSEETNVVPEAAPVNLEEPKGIKEITDVTKALDKVKDLLVAMLADGRIDGSDVLHVVSLLKDLDVFVEAVKGGGEIDDEFKDLDQAEVLVLGAWAFNFVKDIVGVVKKK